MSNDPELRGLLDRFTFAVADCGLSTDRIAPVIGLDEEVTASISIARPPSEHAEDRIRQFVDLLDLASLIFGGRSAAGAWLTKPNPSLSYHRSPLELLSADSSALPNIRQLLEQQCQEMNLIPRAPLQGIWL